MFELQKAQYLCRDLNASSSFMKRPKAVKASLGDLQRAAENCNEHRTLSSSQSYGLARAYVHSTALLHMCCFISDDLHGLSP